MGSQQDLDQGGTSREWVNTYLGPTVGWVRSPVRSVLLITAGGTYTLNLSTTLAIINTTAAVTIILPSAKDSTIAGASAVLPGVSIKNIVTIVDIGGTPLITIQPAATETIMGIANITLNTAYGSYALRPDNILKGWSVAQ